MLFDWEMPGEVALAVLVNTPGIPVEWVYAVAGIRKRRRDRLRQMIGADEQLVDLGQENAASIVAGDGFRMLRAIPAGYRGAVPLWSQLELKADPRSDQVIADELGVNRQKVQHWRTNAVFDPVTGVRLIAAAGRQPRG